ncbi:MAG: cytochrome c biogenesis protein ResB, partial [Candidatus Aminicenantes bacterium]|nr:cytochrome c biogenesis protein ResB [Candidatus Aminicenantes bacterium]
RNTILKYISSSRLALVLVFVILIFFVIGAVLPQQGLHNEGEIVRWQGDNPLITSIAKPLGFFRVFTSIPFIVIIFLLWLNTLTCTIKEFYKRGSFKCFTGADKIKNSGFFLLHISILLMIGSGGWSAATKMDARIILTEGQTFTESHNNYRRITKGPLRNDKHKGFVIKLNKVSVDYESKIYHVDTASEISIFENGKKVDDYEIKINNPLEYSNINITQDKTGYSPHIAIKSIKTGRVIINSFIALKTFEEYKKREYKDYIPSTLFNNIIVLTFFPDHEEKDGKIIKTGENIVNPVLLVEEKDHEGNIISRQTLSLKSSITIGEHNFSFVGVRRWASFRLLEDPGYKYFYFAVWLSIFSLLLRYSEDLYHLFRKDKRGISS